MRKSNLLGGSLLSLLGGFGLAITMAGCQSSARVWRQQLTGQLPVMGHRNWIVIADSAYPAQCGAGLETLYTGAEQLEVVREVLAQLDDSKHVEPVVYLDAELDHVSEVLAPGIESYREGLNQLLQNRRVVTLPHEQLIARLDEAGQLFRVMILKTDLTLPYTSVFIELDCGYWGPEPERQLRQFMSRGR